MTDFPRKADLVTELHGYGESFLAETRNTEGTEEPGLYDFSELRLNQRLRALGEFVISGMTPVPTQPQNTAVLDLPVFEWDGSVESPIIRRANNPLLNSSDCFPPSLIVLATDYIEQGYGSGTMIYDDFVRKVGALFLSGATPRDFQVDASRHGTMLHFADHTQSPMAEFGHVASGKLLYRIISEGGLPAFDIHDIAHHATQMGIYGEFYQWLTSHATREVMASPETLRQRRLIRTVLLTSLEHSIVAAEHGAQSFGCLNWQAPRKSVLATGVSARETYDVNQYVFGAQDINLWSAIRAIASIYREQLEAEELLGVRLNWMSAMGYDMDAELLARVQPFKSYDYSDLTFDSARRATLVVPESPEQLLQNCRNLVEEEFD